ncbi:MAG TPA: DUF5071 domain-containing protein [Terriglobales bacterium]|nr:DUF5071 domain-containing protein [Terriglobales bacterium]
MTTEADDYPRGQKRTWYNQAIALADASPEQLIPEIANLLPWLKDGNWPGAGIVGELLCKLGPPVVPHVKRLLREDDDSQWKYWLILTFACSWPRSLVNEISEELMCLAREVDGEGVDRVALKALLINNLIDEPTATKLIDEKKLSYPSEDIEELKELLASMGK